MDSVRFPVKLAPVTVKVLVWVWPSIALKASVVGLAVIVGATAVPDRLTVLLSAAPPPLTVTLALLLPATVGLYVTVMVTPLLASAAGILVRLML